MMTEGAKRCQKLKMGFWVRDLYLICEIPGDIWGIHGGQLRKIVVLKLPLGVWCVMQHYKVFFGDKDPRKASAPSLHERQRAVSRDNPACPFSKFVGNEKAIRKLQAAAFDALGKPDQLCRDLAFALFGPASCGKTTLAKMFAGVLELPFVEVSPKSVKSMDDVFTVISRVLAEEQVPLVEVLRPNHYKMPPSIIFFDEVHAVSQSVVDGLLKATEHSDGTLVTENGKTINCHNVCWMLATTDEGKLFDAFRTRFSSVNLKYLPKKDIAKIVRLANPDFSDEVCNLVSHYNSRVPRKALEFARYMKLVQQMEPGRDWKEVAKEVAADEGIDEFGMHETHLTILKALGQGAVAKNRIVNVAGKKIEEVERFIMPWLLSGTDDSEPLVTVSNRGYTITQAGLTELEKRDIDHKGSAALPRVV